jgi:microtubule-associated protein 1
MNLKTLAALMAAASFLTLGAVHASDKAAKPAEPAKAAESAKPAEPAHAEKKVAKKKTEHATTAGAPAEPAKK